MELTLALTTAYLLITLLYSTDCFIRSAIIFIVFGCAYAISAFFANGYIFYIFAAAVTAVSLPFFRVTVLDAVKLALVSFVAVFWLGTAEYVDGFAYSELFVALGIALSSYLLFSPSNRQLLCITSILISYGLTVRSSLDFNALALASALCVGWIFTQNYYGVKEFFIGRTERNR